MNVPTISPLDLMQLHREGRKVELIDVRTPAEYQELHATPARNVPLDRLDPAALASGRDGSAGGRLYLICRSGGRGRQACQKLLDAGCVEVVNVEGGTLAWEAAGLPVVRGKKAVSLERQVRIAAGLLVCLGALLAWLVHPAFVAISAFVGAGLVFAGVTDNCCMGLLLARMPWNQADEPTCSCASNP